MYRKMQKSWPIEIILLTIFRARILFFFQPESPQGTSCGGSCRGWWLAQHNILCLVIWRVIFFNRLPICPWYQSTVLLLMTMLSFSEHMLWTSSVLKLLCMLFLHITSHVSDWVRSQTIFFSDSKTMSFFHLFIF